jgi:plasmid stabilization system protein ParE
VGSRRLWFNPLAEAELQDAAAWYEDRLVGLGARFLAAVRHKTDEILESPTRWPLARGTRRVLMGRYPYAIVYREVSTDAVEIVAVAHVKRRPGYWANR